MPDTTLNLTVFGTGKLPSAGSAGSAGSACFGGKLAWCR